MKNLKHFNTSRSLISNSNNYSSFWMDNEFDFDRKTSIFDEEDVKPKTDLIALSSYRRAIGNFVRIVTQKDIPVTFKSSGDSYTDGKKVVISAKMDDKSFDPSVGLALHEGSHIVLSDFDYLKDLENNTPQELFHVGETKGYSRQDVLGHVKNLLNYVEDRRIDNYIFTSSPGYKGYYHSMYDKYFHSKVIDKALLTDEYTSLDWDSYLFRILNLTNKNRRLDVLPKLKMIWELIFKVNGGVKNLKTTKDAFIVALDVVGQIYKNLPDGIEETNERTGEIEKKPASDVVGEGGSSELSDEEFEELKEKIENNEVTMSDGSDGGGKKVELTEAQSKSLERAITKQRDFVNGDVKKVGKLSKKDSRMVKTMEEAGVTHEEAGKGYTEDYDYNSGKYIPSKGTKVVVVKKLTQAMIDDRMFPAVLGGYRDNEESINKGVRLGTMLGKKLQVRGESRETKWTRKDTGRIDKRLIAELGFGNDRVFSSTFVESYSDAILHISIDASGSMSGDKWDNTITSVVAICKAASMIQNVDVIVSFRSTHDTNDRYSRRNSGESFPLVLVGYDSRVDKFSKITRMWRKIHPGGTTPEGLCFEAIMDEIIPTTNDRDSYFLNFSDGMPMFSNSSVSYYHSDAVNHTRRMVNEIRTRGIKVLSYYVGSGYGYDEDNRDLKNFKTMYGKDAEFIDVTSVMSVSKTMNKKFLEKS